MTERKLKGLNFRTILAALEKQHGEDARAHVEASVTGELRQTLEFGGILVSAWYPASWYGELLGCIATEIGGGAQTIRGLSRDALKSDFKTVFRVMRLFFSPELAAAQSRRVAARYIDGGHIDVVSAEPGRMHYRLTEFPGYSHLMWWDFIGGVEGVLVSMGAETLSVNLLNGGQDGDDHMEFVLRWTE
ncbi:MAG: hypothetical protein AB8I08_03260 [Sandaracinaceae bacterium]